ncbi:MAG TPA: methyltransferase [Mycobacteriales bacterium]|nr:methyltransferase [Mycobacteriales bacterium]
MPPCCCCSPLPARAGSSSAASSRPRSPRSRGERGRPRATAAATIGTLQDPQPLLADAPRVRDALVSAGWSSAALEDLLGPGFRSHLERGEGAALLRRCGSGSPLARLARALVLGLPAEPGLLPASWLGADGRALVRLQALHHDGLEVTVPHDPGEALSQPGADQVLGAGAASLTLAAATPRQVVGRALDVGCGQGLQAVLLSDHAHEVVATDRNPRAVALTQLAAALAGADLTTREGDLLEPVTGERFDLVVSNPPFVVSPRRSYTYRDGGLEGDELCHRLVAGIPALLAPGGHAVLLVNWLHLQDEDGDDRVRSWFEGTGCDGWVVQRELADPQEYVTAWLRDTDEARFDELFDEWVDALAGVDAVAFGVVALHRRTDGLPPQVVLDVVDQRVAPAWGDEVLAHFVRRGLLEGDLLQTRLRLRPDVRLHEVAARTDDGWSTQTRLLQQEEGLRWNGAVDGYGASLLAACDGTHPLAELIGLLAAAIDEPVGVLTEQVLPVVRRLVEQGFLGP